ncbi:TRAP transporter large permease subunit [Rhodobacteraceae bacterium KMM 6894]|nr:TRAP transporter large permease subunit [Rhodobacteraceae bacterium KMM 6894]
MPELFLNDIISIAMFLGVIAIVLSGFPVAFALAGGAFGFAMIGAAAGVFDTSILGFLPSRVYGVMTNEVLVAILLFVFMGIVLEKSRIAEEMLEAIGLAFRQINGGLGFGVLIVGMLLAASTGIVGATVVTMGLLSLPTMIRNGYSVPLSTGIICASGTLGQIIPPSILLIILGDQLSSAYLKAMQEAGNFGFDPLSIIDLFAGALLPGLMLVAIYAAYLVFLAIFFPRTCPPMQSDGARTSMWRLVLVMLPALCLILIVLGTILTGIATPTEAAGVGAAGALFIAALKGRLSLPVMTQITRSALIVTSMIFMIFIGASIFSLVFRGFGGDELVERILTSLPGGRIGAIAFVLILMFVMGFFLEYAEIVLITIPIVGPVIFQMDVDPIWFGVMVGVTLQTSFLTPPFGFALFYLRGVAPPEVTTSAIYRGIVPFVLLQLLAVGLLMAFPAIATWLPNNAL